MMTPDKKHLYRIAILCSLDPDNEQIIANITSFACNQLNHAKGFTLVKRGVESCDLLVQPNKETKE